MQERRRWIDEWGAAAIGGIFPFMLAIYQSYNTISLARFKVDPIAIVVGFGLVAAINFLSSMWLGAKSIRTIQVLTGISLIAGILMYFIPGYTQTNVLTLTLIGLTVGSMGLIGRFSGWGWLKRVLAMIGGETDMEIDQTYLNRLHELDMQDQSAAATRTQDFRPSTEGIPASQPKMSTTMAAPYPHFSEPEDDFGPESFEPEARVPAAFAPSQAEPMGFDPRQVPFPAPARIEPETLELPPVAENPITSIKHKLFDASTPVEDEPMPVWEAPTPAASERTNDLLKRFEQRYQEEPAAAPAFTPEPETPDYRSDIVHVQPATADYVAPKPAAPAWTEPQAPAHEPYVERTGALSGTSDRELDKLREQLRKAKRSF